MAESADRPLRITIVQGPFLPAPPLRGGAIEKAMTALGRELARAGHAVTHLSRRFDGLADEEAVDGVRHLRLPSVDMPKGEIAFRWHELRYCRRVRRALPPGDAILANLVLLPLLPLPRGAGRLCCYLARHPKLQVRLYRQASALLAASRAVADGVAAVAPGMVARTRVVHTPYAHAFADARPDDRSRAREILFVGRLHPEKGIETLVGAFRHLAPARPDWHLRLVGPWRESEGGGGAAYRDALRARAEGLPVTIDEPIFDDAALAAAYGRAALFVYPSIAARGEALPMAPLEAMACGAVPVVSALAAFADYLEPGRNGIVFDHRADDPAGALAAALAAATADEAALDAMRAAARATAARFAPAPIAASFVAALREIVDG